MYSRYHDRPQPQKITLPENYGGCAFSAHYDRPEEPPRRIDVAKPTPPPIHPPAPETPMPPPPRPIRLPPQDGHREAPEAKEDPPSSPLPIPVLSELGIKKGFPFSHGIGFDELLLIGLIVLLSGSDQNADMTMWLILLLFMG